MAISCSPSTIFVFALGILVLTMSTCCHTVEGFAPISRQLHLLGTVNPTTTVASNSFSVNNSKDRPITTAGPFVLKQMIILQMANDGESEKSKAKRKNQQLGAAALLLFGILYDFFVTHNGAGFWDPNYVP